MKLAGGDDASLGLRQTVLRFPTITAYATPTNNNIPLGIIL